MLSRAATRLAAARPIATRQAAHANVTRALSSRESGVLSLLLSRGVSTPSFAARQRLQSLRTAADGAAADANQQYQLLKEANRLGDYAFVIGRVESNQFASNAGVKFEYNKALQTRQQKTQRQAYEQQQQQHQQQVSYADPAYAYHGQPYAPSYGSSAGAYAGGNSSAPGSAPSNPLILREVTPKISWSESFYGALPRIAIVLALWGAYTWYRHNHESDGTGGSLFSNPFGPTKDFLNREMSSVRFADVKGCDEAKAELQEVVEFLKNPTKFERLGGKMTKGVLLTGEPGTGQTRARTQGESEHKQRTVCEMPVFSRCLVSMLSHFLVSQVRLFSRRLWPARRVFRSSPRAEPNSTRCSSASVRSAFASCSPPRASRSEPSSSSTRSMRSVATATRLRPLTAAPPSTRC